MPGCRGPCTTCYTRFIRWRHAGVWDHALAVISRYAGADFKMIDRTTVRAHQHVASIKNAADRNLGRSRGGLTTKIHAVVDAKGFPIRLVLTPEHQLICTRFNTPACIRKFFNQNQNPGVDAGACFKAVAPGSSPGLRSFTGRDHLTRIFRNCHGSFLSRSSLKNPGRPSRGVQSV